MSALRCFICAARAFEPTDRTLLYSSGRRRAFPFACSSCGLLVSEDADIAECRADLADRLSAGTFDADETLPYGLDVYTLRIAASMKRRGIRPSSAAQNAALRHPHGSLSAAADLFDLYTTPPTQVALGILCRPAEAAAVLASLYAATAWADEAVLLLDDAPSAHSTVAIEGFAGAVTIASRPLGGDFAAQRNALAAFSALPWMMQLDADEMLEPEAGALLGALARRGDEEGLLSIGLTRRNIVDGVLSDVFPDTQYRLNRREVLFEGRVHERPVRDWRQSTIALHGAILHRLERTHVEKRSQRYEAMAPGQGRVGEAAGLLDPYRD